RDPRPRDGGQDAPARDRAARGPRDQGRALRSLSPRGVDQGVRRAPARGARHRHRSRAEAPRAAAAGSDAVRAGFFFKEAFRALSRSAAPSLAAMLTVLLTALVLGVFI